jgi:hypothetical protein
MVSAGNQKDRKSTLVSGSITDMSLFLYNEYLTKRMVLNDKLCMYE